MFSHTGILLHCGGVQVAKLGHVGITGNVIADVEDKEAAKKVITGQRKAPATISVDDAR